MQKHLRDSKDTAFFSSEECPVLDQPMNLTRRQRETLADLGNGEPDEVGSACHRNKGPTDPSLDTRGKAEDCMNAYVTNTLTAVTSVTVIDAGIIL
jgi:hypothetical protein